MKAVHLRRRVECVPPKPMVISVDNNAGPGKWLRLFIEVSLALLLSKAALPVMRSIWASRICWSSLAAITVADSLQQNSLDRSSQCAG